ncbi:MAG: hypothetical protein ABSG46_16935 [Candidatus Binataceae bacterium]
MAAMPVTAEQWFILTLAAVLGRVIDLIWAHDFYSSYFYSSMIWFIKLVTDLFTDIIAH